MREGQTTIWSLMRVVLVAAFLLAMMRPGGNPVWYLALAFVVSLGLPYVTVPAKLHQNHWVAVDQDCRSIDLAGPELPPDLHGPSVRALADLEALGFAFRGCFTLPARVSNASAHVSLFENPRTHDIAKVVLADIRRPTTRMRHVTLVFATEFSDGTGSASSDSARTGAPPRVPRWHGQAFPQVRDASQLYQIHRAWVDRSGRLPTRAPGLEMGPVRYLCRSSREVTDHLVECRHYYADEAGALLRFTWKGAILAAWKQLWPVKPMLMAMRRWKAKRVVRELGLEGIGDGQMEDRQMSI